jgi:hypothetical protein
MNLVDGCMSCISNRCIFYFLSGVSVCSFCILVRNSAFLEYIPVLITK